MTTYVDRTRIVIQQVCPRKRYYSHHYEGLGISTNRISLPLTVGSMTHVGLENLLKGKSVDEAVVIALVEYDQTCHSRSFAQEDLDLSFVYHENRALIEALIRLYAKIQLPRLLERFEVLEVEKEIELSLIPSTSVVSCPNCNQGKRRELYTNFLIDCPSCEGKGTVIDLRGDAGLILMSRPDAILRERSTGSIYVLSFKTSSAWMGELSESQNRWDVQGISELVATEHWLRTYDMFETILSNGETINIASNISKMDYPEKVAGIKMEHLIKGSYSKSLSDQPLMNISKGQRYYNNILIHPYANAGQFAFGDIDLRFEYEWQDPLSGKTNRLGKDWKRCNIWECGEQALADWIDFMAEDEAGLALLERMIVCPIEYYRNEEDVQEWLTSTGYQEQDVVNKLVVIHKAPETLPAVFPKYRHSCFSYNSPCPYIPICWEGMEPQQLLDTGEFKLREPNHPGEADAISNS